MNSLAIAETYIPEMVAHLLGGEDLNFDCNEFGRRTITLEDLKVELLEREDAALLLDILHSGDSLEAQDFYNKHIKMIAIEWIKDSVSDYEELPNEFKQDEAA